LTTLAEQQNKAYMDAMGQSIQAGQALGNVGSQYGSTGVNVANMEMMGGLPTLAKYSDIINAMGPTTDKKVETVTSKGDYANFLAGLGAIGGAGNVLSSAFNANTSYPWLNSLLSTGPAGVNFGGSGSGTFGEGDY
jgi:hypothetical protein